MNFKKKKPQLEKLCKAFPEKKHGLQTFSTNRQKDRSGFTAAFNNIMGEELGMLSQKLEKDIQIIKNIISIMLLDFLMRSYPLKGNSSKLLNLFVNNIIFQYR